MSGIRPLVVVSLLLLRPAPVATQAATPLPTQSPAAPSSSAGVLSALVPGAAGRPATAPSGVQARYDGSALGLPVMRVESAFAIDRDSYRAEISFSTVGLLSVFVRSLMHDDVRGAWSGDSPAPAQFRSWGTLRGDARRTLIDYVAGAPLVRQLDPPNEGEREAVPEESRGGTVDMLSAAAALVRRADRTGRCDGAAQVFDGRRLTEIRAETVGLVNPSPGDAGPWTGATLLCRFVGRQLAGFRNDDADWAREPHEGAAWLARVVPGGPMIPVRLKFETRWVGSVTLVLREATPVWLRD